jgi:thymidylate synthase
MSDGFPALTTKKLYWKGVVTELLWFLKGETNIKYLVNNNCHIWDGDAYKHYINSHEIKFNSDGKWKKPIKNNDGEYYHPEPFNKEEFIEHILNDDAFAKKWGQMGPIYGKQWRNWPSNNPILFDEIQLIIGWKAYAENGKLKIDRENIDQIEKLINDIKTDPDSRRLIVNSWNPADLPITDYRNNNELYQDYLKDFKK